MTRFGSFGCRRRRNQIGVGGGEVPAEAEGEEIRDPRRPGASEERRRGSRGLGGEAGREERCRRREGGLGSPGHVCAGDGGHGRRS